MGVLYSLRDNKFVVNTNTDGEADLPALSSPIQEGDLQSSMGSRSSASSSRGRSNVPAGNGIDGQTVPSVPGRESVPSKGVPGERPPLRPHRIL